MKTNNGWGYAGNAGLTVTGALLLLVMAAGMLLALGGCKAKKGSTSALMTAGSGKLEGKPVQEWVAQLDHRNSETVAEAVRVLGKAPPAELQQIRPKLEVVFEAYRGTSQVVAGRTAALLVGRLGGILEEKHRAPILRMLVLEDDPAMRRLMEGILQKAVANRDDEIFEHVLQMALNGRHSGNEAASAREILLGDRERSKEIIHRVEAEAMAEAKAKGQAEPDPFEREARRKALEVLK